MASFMAYGEAKGLLKIPGFARPKGRCCGKRAQKFCNRWCLGPMLTLGIPGDSTP